MKIGIACSAGTFKGVFVHGVLSYLNEANFAAEIYAASSSAAITTAYAATGELTFLNGPEEWIQLYDSYEKNNQDVSKTIIDNIPHHTNYLLSRLFSGKAKQFGVAVSAVTSIEAAELTQGSGARRLGKQLILATRNHDRSWAEKNLQTRIFQSGTPDSAFMLSEKNLHEVFYATTRMLHAWKEPASIDGKPYVDASYTCLCPAIELAEMGCTEVIAISPEDGPLYRDFFKSSEIPSSHLNTRIHLIRPSINLAEVGVDYLHATNEGFISAFELGRKAGEDFIESGTLTKKR
jgi:predicted acylesterase/phospholipase RssA